MAERRSWEAREEAPMEWCMCAACGPAWEREWPIDCLLPPSPSDLEQLSMLQAWLWCRQRATEGGRMSVLKGSARG